MLNDLLALGSLSWTLKCIKIEFKNEVQECLWGAIFLRSSLIWGSILAPETRQEATRIASKCESQLQHRFGSVPGCSQAFPEPPRRLAGSLRTLGQGLGVFLGALAPKSRVYVYILVSAVYNISVFLIFFINFI